MGNRELKHAGGERDVRYGGRWTLGQRLKNGSIYVAIRTALALVDRLPSRALLWLGRAMGRSAHLLPGPRRVALDNLRATFGPERATALCREQFVHAGESLALCLLLRRPQVRALDCIDVEPESREVFESALAVGRGVVFVSAHIGPFEMIPAAVEELGISTAIVVRESYDPRLDTVVDQHRRQRGIKVVHRGRSSAPFAILRELRRGRPVGFLPDLGGRVESCATRFLGFETRWPIGPQSLADRLDCPMVIGTLVRTSTPRSHPRFTLRIRHLERADTVADTTQRVADRIAEAILERPADWLWMSRKIASLQTDQR